MRKRCTFLIGNNACKYAYYHPEIKQKTTDEIIETLDAEGITYSITEYDFDDEERIAYEMGLEDCFDVSYIAIIR